MSEEQAHVPKPEAEKPFDNEVFWEKINTKPAISDFGQFFILLGLIGAGVVAGSLITALLIPALTHTSLMDIQKTMLNPQYADVIKTIQIIGTLFMFFFPVLIYALIVSNKPFKHLGFNTIFSRKQVLLIIGISIAALFLSGALGQLNSLIPVSKKWAATFKSWEDSYNDQVVAMMQIKNFGDYLFSLLTIAIVPAIIEETLFRGGIQPILIKWIGNPWTGIIFTSIIFSAIHVSFYGFLSRAMLGIVLGLIFYYTQNMWLNILMHFINNGISVTALYFYSIKGKISKETMNDDTYPLWVGLVALIAVIYLIQQLQKESKTVLYKADLKNLPITH
ncbi:MAG: CPBP family intramembrane metalloprotease [Sphingobacteriia bacterium]|nr:CPBP family intramembrane metalloprotease [Sphingobacteriia bacterium]